MAQLATAWAQVSSRLAPCTQLAPADSVAATAALVHQPAGAPLQRHAAAALPPGGSPSWQRPPQQVEVEASQRQPHQVYRPGMAHSRQGQQQQHQQHHFEAIIIALKLALASLQSAPPRRDGRSPATRAVQLASTLADLCAAGLPLDAFAMCAGVVAEAAEMGALRHDVIRSQLGPSVAALVHDMLRVRQAPRRIELLDDEGAGAVREWCLAFHDVRACVVEVVNCWDELQHMGGMPAFEQQALALEALQIGAPLGHALGLGSLSALMEDACLKVLFPDSYASTSAWLRELLDPAEDALFAAQQRLLSTLDAHPGFARLSCGLVVKARTKSLFSVMKKLLHLGDMSRGGRSREELFDLLGMRAIVQPPDFLPPDEAEAAATKACYIVQDVASTLWRPIPARSKDYIVVPKPNGYQSIHLTLQLGQLDVAYDYHHHHCGSVSATEASAPGQAVPSPASSDSVWSSFDGGSLASEPKRGGAGGGGVRAESSVDAAERASAEEAALGGGGPLCLELQIRTAAMDRAAESGDAAHAVYKGGLDARTARQLQAWTEELRNRLSAQPRGRLLLRAASTASLTPEEAKAAEERRRRRRERRAAAATAAGAGAVAKTAALAPEGAVPAAPASDAVTGTSGGSVDASSGDAAAGALAAPSGQSTAEATFQTADSGLRLPNPVLPLPSSALQSSTAGGSSGASSAGAGTEGAGGVIAAGGTGRPVVHLRRDGPAAVSPTGTLPAAGHGSSARIDTMSTAGGGAKVGMLLPRPVRLTVAGKKGSGATSTSAAAPPPVRPVGRTAHKPARSGQVPAPQASNTSASLATPHAEPSSAPLGPRPSPDADAASTAASAGSGSGSMRGADHQAQAAAGQETVAQQSHSAQGPQADGNTARGPGSPQSHELHGQEADAAKGPPHQAPLAASISQDRRQDPGHAHQQLPQPEQDQEAQQEQQQRQQQLVMLFSSLGSVDDLDEQQQQQLVIGLAHRDAAAAAEQLFRHLDVNGDGRLTLGEVRQVLLDLAVPASERDAAALMCALDRNGDGGVSMEEFVEGVSRAQLQLHEREEQERREAVQRAEEQRRMREAQQGNKWQPWQHRW